MVVATPRVWRTARTTQVLVWAFAVAAGLAIPALAYLLYRDESDRWLSAVLLVLTVACLGYAWRFGLYPRLAARDDGILVVNPFRRARLGWEDLTVLAPGENGLVLATAEQRIEAWCVQKSTRAIRAGRRTRADAIAGQLADLMEQHAPLPADPTTGLRLRRARHDEERQLTELERAATAAALERVVGPDHPFPATAVARRWRQRLLDPQVRVVVLEELQELVGYLAYSADVVLHLGVVPSRTRRGYGSVLLEYATAEIFAGSTTEATLWVWADDAGALAFCRRHGWSTTDEERASDDPPHPREVRLVRRNPHPPRRRH